jgi:hypothetical protein
LAALNAAGFQVVDGNDEDRNFEGRPELFNVFDFSIENHPGDSSAHRGSANLRQSQSSDRFEDDAIGPSLGVGLNKFQNLLALLNAVCIRIEDFDVDAQPLRRQQLVLPGNRYPA